MQHSPLDIIFWLAMLSLAAGAIVVIGMLVRKKLRNDVDEPVDLMPFTLVALRNLRAEGKIDDAEYERVKAGIIARTMATAQPEEEDESVDSPEGMDESGDSLGEIGASDNPSEHQDEEVK